MTTGSWTAFPVGPGSLRRGPFDAPFPDPVTAQGHDWCQVGDSGWHMLLCWTAGPRRVRRTPDLLTEQVVHHRSTGERTARVRSRSAAEQAGVESDVNDYLAEAGVPPRPRGFAWHLLIPRAGAYAELVALVGEWEDRLDAVRPEQNAAAMRAAVAAFYGAA